MDESTENTRMDNDGRSSSAYIIAYYCKVANFSMPYRNENVKSWLEKKFKNEKNIFKNMKHIFIENF